MINRARKWQERQKLLAARAPRVRVDRCTVTERGDGYHYEVVIEGFGLRPAISPPLVTVGGVTLERPRFEPGGRRVTGQLPGRPRDGYVVIDLRYARWEGRAADEAI